MRRAGRLTLVALALLTYFPARFIWDISSEMTRGFWSFMALVLLVLAASIVVTLETT